MAPTPLAEQSLIKMAARYLERLEAATRELSSAMTGPMMLVKSSRYTARTLATSLGFITASRQRSSPSLMGAMLVLARRPHHRHSQYKATVSSLVPLLRQTSSLQLHLHFRALRLTRSSRQTLQARSSQLQRLRSVTSMRRQPPRHPPFQREDLQLADHSL